MNFSSVSPLLQRSACDCSLTVDYEDCTLLKCVLAKQDLLKNKWDIVVKRIIIAM